MNIDISLNNKNEYLFDLNKNLFIEKPLFTIGVKNYDYYPGIDKNLLKFRNEQNKKYEFNSKRKVNRSILLNNNLNVFAKKYKMFIDELNFKCSYVFNCFECNEMLNNTNVTHMPCGDIIHTKCIKNNILKFKNSFHICRKCNTNCLNKNTYKYYEKILMDRINEMEIKLNNN
tara:strand:+ start:147 stop:665 length:519 start_codon:yes stop_codon:yes gene_type:complete